MPVQFTVDAYPKDTFRGKVIQVRMNAQMTSNVVNYMVIIETDNLEGKLYPYMTASVSFEEPKRMNVLVVPNAALRWKPKAAADSAMTDDTAGEEHRLWVVGQDGSAEPVEVGVGATDGTKTEVYGDGVQEGMNVIVGIQSGESPGGRGRRGRQAEHAVHAQVSQERSAQGTRRSSAAVSTEKRCDGTRSAGRPAQDLSPGRSRCARAARHFADDPAW